MWMARIWINGVEHVGEGHDRNKAYDCLNDRWQKRCDLDQNKDRRRLVQLAEHIKYSNQ